MESDVHGGGTWRIIASEVDLALGESVPAEAFVLAAGFERSAARPI